MDWKPRIRAALGARPAPDDDVIEELAQHAAAAYETARAEGADPDEAERLVARQLEDMTRDRMLLRRRPRRPAAVVPPGGPSTRAQGFFQDVRYAGRLIRRQPGYTAVVVLTMALGIAATAVLCSVAYAVLIKPLPWVDADRIVRLSETREGSTRRLRPVVTNGTYLAWHESHTTIEDLAAYSTVRLTLTGAGESERLRVGEVTPGLFRVLRASPVIGRLFDDRDEQEGRTTVAILSHGLWMQRFAGRADVIGQPLQLDGVDYSIVAVMPASFVFPDSDTRAWIPLRVRPIIPPDGRGTFMSIFSAVARLRPGATPAQAAAEGTARARSAPDPGVTAVAVFGSRGPVTVSAASMLDAMTADVRPALRIFLVAVALLLVTAAANVASLQLARGTTRRREMAIRAALGAAAGRLARQTLVENLLLGACGGVAGLLLAAWMHSLLPSFLPADFPRLDDLSFDVRVQVFAIAVSLVTGLAVGLLPALQAGRIDLVSSLAEDSLAPIGGGARTRTARARAIIIGGQVAIAAVLLVGAMLMIRSFVRLLHAGVGYDVAGVLTARVTLPDFSYTDERRLQTLDRIVARIEQVPGVREAAFSTVLPFTPAEMLSSFPMPARDGSSATVQIQTGARYVSPSYFASLGQRIVEGRGFTERDSAASLPVVIVNREFARRYLPPKVLGTSIPFQRPTQIVGVAEDGVRHSVTDVPQPEIFLCSTQQRGIAASDVNLIVRTTGDPILMAPSVRSVVRAEDAAAPLESVMTMEERVSTSLARPRLYTLLLGTFAAFALAIAGVGLFGVLSYSVAQRAREIGVRAALGARPVDIIRLVVGQSLAVAGVGVAAGLLASVWLTGSLSSFLYGVAPRDAMSFAIVAIALLGVAGLASVVPALRAARVDPVKVLKAGA